MWSWNQSIQKYQRTSRAPMGECERRLWSLCSIYGTRLVCFVNDSSKSNECHCKTTWLCRTSSRCSICLHPNKFGGRSQIAQHSIVRVSRHMDTSSTTQGAQILVQHSRPSASLWTKFVWTPTCWPHEGKTVWGSSIGTWMGNGAELRIFVCSSETRTILVGIRGRHQHGWKEAKYDSNVEEIDETGSILENQRHFLTTCIWDALNVNANRTRILLNTSGKCSNHEFLLEQLINYQAVTDLAQKLSRGPTTWKVMRKSALEDLVTWRIYLQSGCAKSQLVAWMIIFQKEGTGKTVGELSI